MTPSLTPSQFGKAYGVALVVMLLLDGLWLGVLTRDFYRREMSEVMAETVQIAPAALFYLLYPAGVVYLGLMNPPDTWLGAAFRCGIIGLFAYGTYDLTAMSVMRGWSAQLTVIDMLWGTFITAVVGAAAYRVAVGASSGAA